MPHVNVTIAGRSYRMACGEGEEGHLAELAASFDARIAEMRRTFGEIGDMRLHVMAALTVSDEVAELRRRTQALEGTLADLDARLAAGERARSEEQERLAGSVAAAAERIERLARVLGGNSAA